MSVAIAALIIAVALFAFSLLRADNAVSQAKVIARAATALATFSVGWAAFGIWAGPPLPALTLLLVLPILTIPFAIAARRDYADEAAGGNPRRRRQLIG